MCTVTIIPIGKSDFILTSNRDEAPNRTSVVPKFYTVQDVTLLFPKDELSGGTWIGVSEKNRVLCVLNGGFICHERQPNYRLSRGVVAKDLLIAEVINTAIRDYDLNDVEPFTMIVADWNDSLRFLELVWDGHQKHITELPLEAKIWSSATLYSEAMKRERLLWFNDFKSQNNLNHASLMTFHKTAGAGNEDYGVVMDRGFVKTTSITQIVKNQGSLKMHHESFHSNKDKVMEILFNLPQAVNE